MIIGDGPLKSLQEDYVIRHGIEDVHFLGGITDLKKSGEYLFVSDLMVIPGDVGLSANHAFCFGLPVITRETGKHGPFHGPEIEYIKNGTNGFICKNEDTDEMVNNILKVFEHPSGFREKVLEYCETNLTIERMISGIMDAINFANHKQEIHVG